MKSVYKIYNEVWLYPGMAAWHFVNVDTKQSKEIKEKHGKGRRGFGSIPVMVTIGKTTWKTSIFPDKKSNSYLLPLKAVIRKKIGIKQGDMIRFSISCLV